MALPRLVPGTVPLNQQFPPTPQQLLEWVAAYMSVEGIEANASFVFGDTTPAVSDQDKPWLQTDAGGNPVGWYVWDGAAWTPLPTVLASGTTAARPGSPTANQLYFDTDINCALIFERGQWRTLDGSPGDIKFVTAASVGAAITQNPGWSEFTEMRGRSPMGAGTGAGLTARAVNTNYGVEGTELTMLQIPSHTHGMTWDKQDTTGGGQTNTLYNGADNGAIVGGVNKNTGTAGSANPDDVPVIHPVRALVCLTKD